MPNVPSLPETAYAPGGDILIVRQYDLMDEGEECNGLYVERVRTSFINADLRDDVAWFYYFHEQYHAWLCDLGIVLSEDDEELLCQQFASCRMRELLNEYRPQNA